MENQRSNSLDNRWLTRFISKREILPMNHLSLFLLAASFVFLPLARAQVGKSASEDKSSTAAPDIGEGDRAWQELQKAVVAPSQPPEWKAKRPNDDEIAKFRASQIAFVEVATQMAKEFYTK